MCACSFITALHQYGLLSRIGAAAWDADCQDLRPLDATSLRQQKLERFKRDRDIKAKLQQVGCLDLGSSIQGPFRGGVLAAFSIRKLVKHLIVSWLQMRQQQLRRRRLAELEEPGQAEGAAQPDDADVREAWLLQIEQSAHQALAQLSLLKQVGSVAAAGCRDVWVRQLALCVNSRG